MPRSPSSTDTTHYMPRELVAEHGIHEVSLYVNFDGRDEARGRHRRLRRLLRRACAPRGAADAPRSPRSATSSTVYEPLLADGHDIVSIHLSAGISGTCERPRQARRPARRGRDRAASGSSRRLGDRLRGLGLMALAATAAARAGASAADAAARPRRARATLKIWFAVDTLEFLRRGGRIGARAGVARRDAEDQADPLDRVARSRPIERVRTVGPRLRAARRVPAARATTTAADALVRPAHPRAATGASAGRARPRDLRHRSRSSSRRSAR